MVSMGVKLNPLVDITDVMVEFTGVLEVEPQLLEVGDRGNRREEEC